MMPLKIHVVVSLCLLFVMAGCVPTAELYLGKSVTNAPIIKLEKGANVSGTWQTFDVTINYQYQADGDIITLAGQGELSQHYQMVYDGVRYLRVYLFLLDADGLVLETIEIPAFLNYTEDQFAFNKPLKVDASIKSFSFGYRGVATEMDGQAYFDSLPSNRPAKTNQPGQ
jgi:hypothetical protein